MKMMRVMRMMKVKEKMMTMVMIKMMEISGSVREAVKNYLADFFPLRGYQDEDDDGDEDDEDDEDGDEDKWECKVETRNYLVKVSSMMK